MKLRRRADTAGGAGTARPLMRPGRRPVVLIAERRQVPGVGEIRAWRAVGAIDADAAVVVCVHGVGVSSRYMRPVMESLAPVAHVWAPDLPGFGRSVSPQAALTVAEQAEALRAWLATVNLTSVVVLANSFGCQVAIRLAAAHPDRVAGLVLVGPTVDPAAHGMVSQTGRWLANAAREPTGLGTTLWRDLRDAGVRRIWRTFRDALADDPATTASEVRVPALVVRGEHDRIVSRPWVEQLADSFPRGRAMTLPDGAHSVHYSHPDRVAREVVAFAAMVASQGPTDDGQQPVAG